ncbi:hypothetical protein PENTCL1PPCAC_29886, partial [Pristionchus entomophagus]
ADDDRHEGRCRRRTGVPQLPQWHRSIRRGWTSRSNLGLLSDRRWAVRTVADSLHCHVRNHSTTVRVF